MIYLKLILAIYAYFIGLCLLCYVTKKFLEVLENAHTKRIKHFKQYRNRK